MREGQLRAKFCQGRTSVDLGTCEGPGHCAPGPISAKEATSQGTPPPPSHWQGYRVASRVRNCNPYITSREPCRSCGSGQPPGVRRRPGKSRSDSLARYASLRSRHSTCPCVHRPWRALLRCVGLSARIRCRPSVGCERGLPYRRSGSRRDASRSQCSTGCASWAVAEAKAGRHPHASRPGCNTRRKALSCAPTERIYRPCILLLIPQSNYTMRPGK